MVRIAKMQDIMDNKTCYQGLMSNTCSDTPPGCSAKDCKTRNLKHLVIYLQTRLEEMARTVKMQETMDIEEPQLLISAGGNGCGAAVQMQG